MSLPPPLPGMARFPSCLSSLSQLSAGWIPGEHTLPGAEPVGEGSSCPPCQSGKDWEDSCPLLTWKYRLQQKYLPKYSLEGLMLKLKRQYLGHLMERANSLEKTLMGKIEGRKKRG